MDLPVAKPKALLADKGYDGDTVRSSLLILGILPIIPQSPIAASPSHATSADTGTATASSACSGTSSTNATSPHDTTLGGYLRGRTS